MRIGHENLTDLNPDDVAWVVEWQLLAACPWLPHGEVSPVTAELQPDRGGRTWTVQIRAGWRLAAVRVPVRDLAPAIQWCHRARTYQTLLCPAGRIMAHLLAIRAALRHSLQNLDPLWDMGYAPTSLEEHGPG